MTTSSALRTVASIAVLAGYLAAKGSALFRGASRRFSRRAFRAVEGGGVRLQVPDDWGELEREGQDRLVLHNRPKQFRIEGDAVWYSVAIELRIMPGWQLEPRNAEAMTTTHRYMETPVGPVTLELAIANGVGLRQRAIAETVLKNAVPIRPS
jgi:hypothetical protein